MPIDGKRKVHQMANSGRIEDGADCFRIRFTGELFTDYDEFIDTLFSYQSRQWTCALTGKGGMTFEEAQICESRAQRKVDDAFPDIFVEPLCRMAHMSQVRMDELVELSFRRLSAHLPGEVLALHPKDGGLVREVTVVKPLDVDDDWWMEMDVGTPLPVKYEVEPADGVIPDGEEELPTIEVDASELKRYKGKGVSRITIKAKLKTIGSRASYWQAPFLCEAEFIGKFNMQRELPPHLRRLKLQHDVRTGKADKDALMRLDPGGPVPAKRKKKKSEDGDPQKAALKHLASPLRKKMWQNAEKTWISTCSKDPAEMNVQDVAQVLYTGYLDGGHKEAYEAGVDVQTYMDECHAMLSLMLATWPKDQPHEPGTPLLLPLLSLPIEDTMLPADPTLESRPPLCEMFAIPDTDYVLPTELAGRVLSIWDFVVRFSKVVSLSPFEFDDLCAALCSEENSPLAQETILGLLRYVLREREAAKPEEPSEVDPEAQLEPGAVLPPPKEPETEIVIGEYTLPKAPSVDEGSWVSIIMLLVEALRSASPHEPMFGEATEEVLRKGEGFEGLNVHMRVELFEAHNSRSDELELQMLVEHAAETSGVHKHLDKALNETRELHKSLRDEEAALREKKKESKIGKLQALERLKQQALIDGGDAMDDGEDNSERGGTPVKGGGDPDAWSDEETGTPVSVGAKARGTPKVGAKVSLKKQIQAQKEAEKDEKARQKAAQAAAKEARLKQKEEEAKLEEEERKEKENMHKSFEAELEKHAVRASPLGLDRDEREYWMFGGKEWRIYVRDPRIRPRRGPAKLSEDGAVTEGQVCEDRGEGAPETWGFYDQPEQIDGLLAYLFQNGLREGPLYEQLSMRYMKITHNMRKRIQELNRAEIMTHAEVRRSVRIKTENVTRQMPHMSYVNLLKDLTDGKPKSRRSGGGTAPTPV